MARTDTLRSRTISAEAAPDWDGLVTAAPDGHLLQSFRWGEFKARHGWTVQRFHISVDGAFAAAQVLWHHTPLGPMGYIPRGPVLVPRGHEAAARKLMREIHRAGRARGAVFLKAEPSGPEAAPLPQLGFRPSAHTAQPRVTLVVDLTLSLETLLRRMHHKTRYNIRLAEKKGVEVVQGSRSDIPVFVRMMRETARRNRIGLRSFAYYRDILVMLGDSAELLLARHEGEILAGIIVGKFNGEAIYLYGASTSHKRNLMPTYLLQWEAMRRAKEQGLIRYDFWAVPPELAGAAHALPEGDTGADDLPLAREHRPGDLWGVYRFKRGFGGRLVAYCGAYDYVYSPTRYLLWQQVAPPVLDLLLRARRTIASGRASGHALPGL